MYNVYSSTLDFFSIPLHFLTSMFWTFSVRMTFDIEICAEMQQLLSSNWTLKSCISSAVLSTALG